MSNIYIILCFNIIQFNYYNVFFCIFCKLYIVHQETIGPPGNNRTSSQMRGAQRVDKTDKDISQHFLNSGYLTLT